MSTEEPRASDDTSEAANVPGAELDDCDEEVDGEHVPDGESVPEHTPGVPRVEIRAASFSGPLPPPATLREYNEIVPGLAREIVDQWKGETAHRHQVVDYLRETDRLAMHGYYAGEKRGQIFGFIAIVLVVALSALAVVLDRPVIGVAAALITALAGAIWAMRRASVGGGTSTATDLGNGDEVERTPPADEEPQTQ